MTSVGFDMKFEGLDKLYEQFNVSKSKAKDVTASAMRATVAKAQQTAQSIVPVRTGYLRQNIVVKPVKINGDTITGEFVASQADYASYVEYGTYKMRAQPYMRPAVASAKPFFYSKVESALKGVM
ncbi:HK97-gp10 family putative phage morphogenesis protein [Liquorilactobacillus mali]|uniref:Phage protein n=1 Tax=Liquorilactobacillus mali KCTC 3596 = DSM 20444 TaxID=1046596 RepID=J1F509_9LACO|nr:HK97-gp10 family putative phage morphogenesis protein [Liquorilactobacillus mali]EJF01244.1 phage protein [Liquorilactobacillus mali KCTC 3596 = DSM 20444]KRN08953.1 phage protein [Liquorilactobacillus mali KCTC 3596 = DSM 20444]MDC7953599.1 HK97 gp10 family phage protein [Liquorilactobacillus mali]QFQ74981.1 hypothetical protein LM596_07545 [Liquorilactobacillus mali]